MTAYLRLMTVILLFTAFNMVTSAGEKFELVTDASSLKAGDVIAFAYVKYNRVMGPQSSTKNNFTAKDVLINNNQFESTSTISPLILGGETGRWTFMLQDGAFLCAASSYGNYLRQSEQLTPNCRASISIDKDGNANITFDESKYNRNSLRYYSKGNVFSCYTPSSPIAYVQIFRKIDAEEINLTVPDAGYSTLYYSNSALTVPAGGEAYTYKLNGSNLVVNKTYSAGDVIPAGEAVVMKVPAGTYKMLPATTSAVADPDNLLQGTDEDQALPDDGSSYFYKLSLNSAMEKGSVGFYWDKANGRAFTNKAHKAYLRIPTQSMAKSVFLFAETTSISQPSILKNKEKEMPIFNLAGQRVDKNYKGIVVKNGRKHLQNYR